MFLVKRYGDLLDKRPLITKTITSFITFGLGDAISQYLIRNTSNNTYDFIRTFNQASFGFLIAPYFHLQFCKIMPYLFPVSKKLNLIKSIIYDQTLSACIFTVFFFTYLDLCLGKEVNQIKEDLKIKLLPTLYMNWTIWPFLMLINFSLVPLQWRVLFNNLCGMFWTAYLAYIQNNKKSMLKS